MTLYHYTTLDNFFLIWESKALRFSYSKNTNDYFEREKTYVFCQDTFTYKGKPLDRTYFKDFRQSIGKELERYRQVSFCLDYSRKMPGYASPMMWGQYARSELAGSVPVSSWVPLPYYNSASISSAVRPVYFAISSAVMPSAFMLRAIFFALSLEAFVAAVLIVLL